MVNQKSRWPEDGSLRLAGLEPRCRVLGPGVRAVLWVQGCPFRCPGCVAPETLPFVGGQVVAVADLARQLVALSDIDGLTFSGGEPMAQAVALADLVDSVRRMRDLSVFCYTGYTLEALRLGDSGQRRLLERIDVLVDGPYIAERHTDRRWRGSENQRVHFLTDRYRHLAAATEEHGVALEVTIGSDGLRWMGIPPLGFREQFEQQMIMLGIQLKGRE